MLPPVVDLLGDKEEAEKLRGFALSQLRILRNTMEFQGLKQYTRVVRFSDGSYIRAFSVFGLNTVTIFVPLVSIPERKVVEIRENVYIVVEPCEVALELPVAVISVVNGDWVYKGQRNAQCPDPYWQDCPNDNPACANYDNEIISGNEKWVFDGNSNSRCQECAGTAFWGSGGGSWVDPPCGDPITCHSPPYRPACSDEGCICSTYFVYYYVWECD